MIEFDKKLKVHISKEYTHLVGDQYRHKESFNTLTLDEIKNDYLEYFNTTDISSKKEYKKLLEKIKSENFNSFEILNFSLIEEATMDPLLIIETLNGPEKIKGWNNILIKIHKILNTNKLI